MIFLLFLIGFLLSIAQAVILAQGWQWFAVPMGAPTISFGVMFAFCIMYRVLSVTVSGKQIESHTTTNEADIAAAAVKFVLYVIMFGVLFITKSIVN